MADLHISIREFAPSDRETVIALMLELQRFELPFAPDHAAADRDFGEWYVERMLREVRENMPCGFVAGYDAEDPEARGRHFYIAELSVSETMRGRRVGSRLIAAIGVLAQSRRVHALCDRLGYRDHAVRLRKTS